MPRHCIICIVASLVFMPFANSFARAQDDVAGIPSQELRIRGDEHQRYFLLGPKNKKLPAAGFKLLIIMPGGDGSADFAAFCKRIYKNSLGDDYVAAELVAPKWSDGQKIVWPTSKSRVLGMKVSVEEFAESVIKEISGKYKIDPHHVYTLSWSSSGPAAYAISTQKTTAVTGSFIAMSVFHKDELALGNAKGRTYYLLQSPEDTTCPFRFAEEAKAALGKAGATVTLVKYDGGHGWHGDIYGGIRRGVKWLEQNSGKPAKSGKSAEEDAANSDSEKEKSSHVGKPDTSAKATNKKRSSSGSGGDKNLIENGGFEHGTEGWEIINNSGRAKIEIDTSVKSRGKQSLRVDKTGGPPMDVIRRNIAELPKGGKVTVSAMVKTAGVKNAFFKFFIYDADEKPLVEDVDIAHLTGSGEWKKLEKTFDVPDNAVSGAVMFVMVLDGKAWLDEVRVIEGK